MVQAKFPEFCHVFKIYIIWKHLPRAIKSKTPKYQIKIEGKFLNFFFYSEYL